jgi:ssRNA-specific RNase YbeY (16S rRNA maturation enzyme)
MYEAQFKKIKNKILGKDYDLSWAFITPKKIQKLNLIYRNMNKPTDILSFPLSKNEGEIYICKSESKKKRRNLIENMKIFSTFCLSTDVSI